MSDVERLLRSALVPIEPPERLSDRLERGLSELTEAAADQLADWELSSMRDPRNWARPVGAVVVGTLAGGALVVVRARQQQRKRNQGPLQAIERGIRDVAEDLEKRLRR
jgi:predicted nucleic acid-binding protein